MVDVENVPNLPTGGKIVLAQLSNTSTGDLNSVNIFEGKLSGFNMWDYVMDKDAISMLALACGRESGNLISWANARNGVNGQVDVISLSSCKYILLCCSCVTKIH
jgi:hypothetical protein